MIPLVEEGKELFQTFRFYEDCYFGCGNTTKFWHWRTNQPVCPECAKKHKVSDLPKCSPNYKPVTKEEYINS